MYNNNYVTLGIKILAIYNIGVSKRRGLMTMPRWNSRYRTCYSSRCADRYNNLSERRYDVMMTSSADRSAAAASSRTGRRSRQDIVAALIH